MTSRKANLGFIFEQYVIARLSASTQVSIATPQIPVRGYYCLESGFKTLAFSLMICHRSPHHYCAPSSTTVVTFSDCATALSKDGSLPNFTSASVTIHICAPSSATAVTFPDYAPSSATAVTFPDCVPSSSTAVTFPDCATAVFINDRSFPNFTAASVTMNIFPDCTPPSVTLHPFPERNTAFLNDRSYPVSFHLPSPVDNILILFQFLPPATHILKPLVIFRRDSTSRN